MPLDLAVVLVTPDTFETVRSTVRALHRQTVVERMELLLAVPDRATAGVPPEAVERFGRVELVEVGQEASLAAARRACILEASAPIVALSEDHVYPDPDWADALVRAHDGPAAAVGPVVFNANPNTLVSWADMLVGYAPWMPPQPAGPVDLLPGHNSAYKREVLLDYGDELERMLEAETVLFWDLRSRGRTLRLEPSARIGHLNFAVPSVWFRVLAYNGRVFAAQRARHWSWLKRIGYAGGSPLIPLVRFARIAGQVRRSRSMPEAQSAQSVPLGVWPLLFAGLVLDGLGQGVGYLFGGGDAMKHLDRLECNRIRYARIDE